jgi:hypothetical protein
MEVAYMKELEYSPLLVIDNLVRTLMMAGAVFIAGLIIANPTSWLTKVAMVALVAGFLFFLLTAQFLITIEMQDWGEMASTAAKARSPRLALPFLCGVISYALSGTLICIYFITK